MKLTKNLEEEIIRLKAAVKRSGMELSAANRELEIEMALEKVRACALRMRRPEDMLEVCKTISEQLQFLGAREIRNVQTAIIHTNTKRYTNYEYFVRHQKKILTLSVEYDNHSMSRAFVKKMQCGTNTFFKTSMKGRKVQEWFEFQKTTNQFLDKYLAKADSLTYYWYSLGPIALGVSTYQPLTKEEEDLLIRFKNVFELSYCRYLDIEKAESQAREAQIEAALEKIRSRSLAMHHSNELKDVIGVVFEKMKELDVLLGTVAIWLFDLETKNSFSWLSNDHHATPILLKLPRNDRMMKTAGCYKDAWQARLSGKNIINKKYSAKEKNAYFDFVFDNNELTLIPTETRNMVKKAEHYSITLFVENNSALFVDCMSGQIYNEERLAILGRVAKVFEQAYVRFLDLQKAEAQARESQIETALERVRSIAMSMMQSEDLSRICEAVYKQLNLLGFHELRSAQIYIRHDEEDKFLNYDYSDDTGANLIEINYNSHPNSRKIYDMIIAAGDELIYNEVRKKELEQWKNYLYNTLGQPKEKVLDTANELNYYLYSFGTGAFGICNFKKIGDEELLILKRFRNVFSLAYQRYTDISFAEAQAREARIEASLERVRSKAMAMHNSQDLSDTIGLFYRELHSYSIHPLRCGVGLLDKNEQVGEMYTWNTNEKGESLQLLGYIKMEGHPILTKVYEGWLAQKEYHPVLRGNEIKEYYKVIRPQLNFPDYNRDEVHYGYFFFFREGGVYAWTNKEMKEDELQIYRRFTTVLSLTYKRYKDLQQAEANAREAQIETALEKVRSRTLAMQKSDELPETATVLFQQLIALGIEPARLYISIINEANGEAEFWITDEEGSKVSTAYSANLNNNISLAKMLEGWKKQKKSLVLEIEGEELDIYISFLKSLGVSFKSNIPQKKRVQDLAYFSNGFIGMASPEIQAPATLQLLERFAYVFNLTFTRFSDLKIAEANALQAEKDLVSIMEAKQKAESTLNELQSTQKLLVQSEKMASLGELTAGIAHEIQNPLNFVNNFSEVSNELIDEMKAELTAGNFDMAIKIAADLGQNLEKIIHHGKRADGIVKGMLQHSRKSGSEKEPTDLNNLADEYLRLAYHGLRAKDKSFNASLKTEFDSSIGKINILAQDIGRVILNLVNNAFYAVNQKRIALAAKGGESRYEPTVSLTTKKSGGIITVSVKDNGNGIPKDIVDKIFQPFFTTKPTGSGTGLGLSLAYDIVKAHGGELTVNTEEGSFTEFIIILKEV